MLERESERGRERESSPTDLGRARPLGQPPSGGVMRVGETERERERERESHGWWRGQCAMGDRPRSPT